MNLNNLIAEHVTTKVPTNVASSLRFIAFAITVILLATNLSAANRERTISQYNSRSWQLDEGLPHNQVQAIAQTPDGYLWVGTRNGLAKFDGISFTSFDERLAPGMNNAFVDALCTDRNGTLWIGTFSGLYTFKNGVCQRYGRTNGLASDEVNALVEGKDGSVWIGTTKGLSRHLNGKFMNYTQNDGLSSEFVNSLFEDRDGCLWLGTSVGVTSFKSGIFKSFGKAEGLPSTTVLTICADKTGKLWVGSFAGLMWKDHEIFRQNSPESRLSEGLVVVIYADSRGNLWVGTHDGLYRFRDGVCTPEFNNEGFSYDKVNDVYEDREGNIWVGSREGLIRRAPKQLLTYTRLQGLSHNNVMSAVEDLQGNLWVGTWGGGVDRLAGGEITTYTTSNGFPNNLILSLCDGRDGSLWAGADYDGGLIQLKDGKYTTYTWKNGLINGAIRVLYKDSSSNIWAGTESGLSCLHDGKFINYTTKDHLPNNLVRAICEDHAGNLWFGTDGGLSCWKGQGFTNFTSENGLSENSVIALYEDQETNLWIGTLGGGLNRYHDGKFTAYTKRQGLFSDEVFEIVEDDFGYLWMTCSRGIFRVLKKDLEKLDATNHGVFACISYGKSDGMESSQCNGVAKPGAWKLRDGRICFPTTKGFVVAEPGPVPEPKERPPQVYITDLIADNRKLDFDAGRTGGAQTNSEISLPPGRGELEFHYTALSLFASEKNRFKYKLEGADSDWIEADTRRLAHYNNLYPGRYRFLVLACNDHGVWNELGAALSFELLPHIWQTWWFLGSVAFCILGSVAGAAQYVSVKRIEQKLFRLEQQQAISRERARIARDLHDDLGASLTQITLLSALSEKVAAQSQHDNSRKISARAREMAQSLDEIVWAVNPAHDTLEGLVEYLSQSADEFLEETSILLRLKTPEKLPRVIIPAEVRHQVFLAFKEALNNAVKHGGASEIKIELLLSQGQFQILIADNGKGFDAAAAHPSTNGLSNMKRRLAMLGGGFEIQTQPGGGTEVRLSISLSTDAL